MNIDDLRRDCTLLATTLMKKYNYTLYIERQQDKERIEKIIEYSVQTVLDMHKQLEEGIEKERNNAK